MNKTLSPVDHPDQVIAAAKKLLAKASRPARDHLAISDDFLCQDDWLQIFVFPTKSGMSALDYLDVVEDIERTLRSEFGQHISIVSTKS